jgi:prophage DNA circulation protein
MFLTCVVFLFSLPSLTVGFQTELAINTCAAVSDIRHDVANTHSIVSDVHHDVANTHNIVSGTHNVVSGTHNIVSDTHNIVSDIHRAVVKHQGTDGPGRSVSSRCALLIIK